MRTSAIIVAGVGAFLLVACSPGSESGDLVDSSSGNLAEEMITGELATTVGLGPLSPNCGDPGPLAMDTTLACTATTDFGAVIQIDGAVNDEGRLALTTTNLVSAAAIPSFEREVAALLNTTVGSNFTAESVDCGATALILPAEFVVDCALVMPASSEVFDVTLTVTDLDARSFSLVVGSQPRSAQQGESVEPAQ